MGAIPHQRIAQRHAVPTTPIQWKVVRRRKRGNPTKLVLAEAAIVEVSVMGAAIVAPAKWEAFVGTRVEVFWENLSGVVTVRRVSAFGGSSELYLYGVEYAGNNTPLGMALYDRLVLNPVPPPVADMTPAPTPAPSPPVADPVRWVAPNTWSPEV